MRCLLSVALVLPLISADLAWSQTQRRTPRSERDRTTMRQRQTRQRSNKARSSRQKSPRRAGNRFNRTRSSDSSYNWKQRLADARRLQNGQPPSRHFYTSGQRNDVYQPGPTYAYDDYYGNPNGPYGPYAYGAPAAVLDPQTFADLYFGQRYYEDGPNGPGYYPKDRWYNWSIAQRRTDQLHDANRAGVDEGMALFHAGHYDRAAVVWLNASTLDQGDAASRVQAGHALFAIGRYPEAVKLLDRAFELAPQLAGAAYDIRNDYRHEQDFDRHLNRLAAHVAQNPNDVAGLTLMGYVLSYTDGPSHAYAYLQRARSFAPKDTFVEKLWATAEMVGPAMNNPEIDRFAPQSQSAPAPMQQMRPIPQRPLQAAPRPQAAPQEVRQENAPAQPAPRKEKMRLVSAQDSYR